jgi:hypothetical protein
VQVGGFQLSGGKAVPIGSVSLASLFGYAQTDVSEQVDVDVSGVAAGGQVYASEFARRDAAGNMYVGMVGINLAADPRAAVLVWLFQPGNPVNNGWTLLNFGYVTGGAETGTLTFDEVGTSLTASFGGTTIMATDSVLSAAGSAGILSVSTPTSFTNFAVSPPGPQVLDGTPLASAGVPALTTAELAPIVAAAEQRWKWRPAIWASTSQGPSTWIPRRTATAGLSIRRRAWTRNMSWLADRRRRCRAVQQPDTLTC